MIDRNLGTVERLLRFTFGVGLIAFLLTRPELAAVDWFIGAMAVMLMLNGISSRCFFWWALGLNSRKSNEADHA